MATPKKSTVQIEVKRCEKVALSTCTLPPVMDQLYAGPVPTHKLKQAKGGSAQIYVNCQQLPGAR